MRVQSTHSHHGGLSGGLGLVVSGERIRVASGRRALEMIKIMDLDLNSKEARRVGRRQRRGEGAVILKGMFKKRSLKGKMQFP